MRNDNDVNTVSHTAKLLSPAHNEKGFVLVVTLLLLVVLTIIGVAATRNSRIEVQIAGNDKFHKETFYKADGAIETGIQAVEENVSCPTGFTGSNMTVAQRNDPRYFYKIQGLEFADDRFAFDEVVADLPWDPEVIDLDSTTAISLDYVPSDAARSIRIPLDISAPNDIDPRSNIAVFGDTRFSAGSAIQMAAGYEGKGKGAGGAGAYIAYNVHSQHMGLMNSNSRLRVEWRHLVGQEGECNF